MSFLNSLSALNQPFPRGGGGPGIANLLMSMLPGGLGSPSAQDPLSALLNPVSPFPGSMAGLGDQQAQDPLLSALGVPGNLSPMGGLDGGSNAEGMEMLLAVLSAVLNSGNIQKPAEAPGLAEFTQAEEKPVGEDGPVVTRDQAAEKPAAPGVPEETAADDPAAKPAAEKPPAAQPPAEKPVAPAGAPETTTVNGGNIKLSQAAIQEIAQNPGNKVAIIEREILKALGTQDKRVAISKITGKEIGEGPDRNEGGAALFAQFVNRVASKITVDANGRLTTSQTPDPPLPPREDD